MLPWNCCHTTVQPTAQLSLDTARAAGPHKVNSSQCSLLLPAELVRTVKCCWASKPGHRPTFEQLVPKLRSLRDAVAVMDIVEKQERDLGRSWGAAVPASQGAA